MATEQTALLYLDNVFPMRMGMVDIRQLFFRNEISRVDSILPKPATVPYGFKVKTVHPRIKDGGALIEFTFESSPDEARVVAQKIVASVAESLHQHRASFNMQPIRTFLVKGEPFLEDMVNRYPSPRLRIEFQGDSKPVSVEKLYQKLREYGRLYDIAVYPNPHTSKEAPRYAIVQFTRIRAATSARNCLHGYVMNDSTTRLNVLYERQLRTNAVKDWIMDHPRITIPVVAALLAGLTYSVFDPLREFFIASKITQRFNPEEYALYRWLRRETWARLLPTGDDETRIGQAVVVWEQDEDNMAKVKAWLREEPETFIVVSGPKGSGKSTLVKATISDRRNRLVIDCEELINTRNISETTLVLAKQVGYFPVFTWIASLTKLIDTLVTAGTGQSAGLASSPHAQIKKVLETTALTLRDVMPPPEEQDHQQQQQQSDGSPANETRKPGVMEVVREWFPTKNSKKSLSTAEEKHDRREEIPVVVIDNFMSRGSPKNDELWQELAEFAALLVENELAHVVFVTSNVGVNKILSKALPGKSFETIQLSDASPEVAVKYIAKEMGVERVEPILNTIAEALGGRLNELELLVQRLKMNMDPEAAFEDIVQRNVVEIRKYGFNDGAENELENTKFEWTPIQYWQVAKALATAKSINYAELKWGPYFKGEDKPLWAMERAEVITIINRNGRPDSVRPGKPIMYTVFRRLVDDPMFSASMEIESHQFLKKQNEETIAHLQETVINLSQVYNGRPPREIETRIKYLLGKIAKLQKDIEASEKHIADAQQAIIRSWKDTDA
ncbi:RNA12 protein-domain-containing protein [Dichotomocladium elegans]|nr:RNA12 protein-domain-containing protein [Dichotomocladium elegans]